MPIAITWRGRVSNDELNALHAEGFDHPFVDHDWGTQLERHSLGWVAARADGQLVGFVNVAWDGAAHAFLLDTLVAQAHRGRGVGTALVARAADGAHEAGCEWVHVDWEDGLDRFYVEGCGFTRTAAGLRRVR